MLLRNFHLKYLFTIVTTFPLHFYAYKNIKHFDRKKVLLYAKKLFALTDNVIIKKQIKTKMNTQGSVAVSTGKLLIDASLSNDMVSFENRSESPPNKVLILNTFPSSSIMNLENSNNNENQKEIPELAENGLYNVIELSKYNGGEDSTSELKNCVKNICCEVNENFIKPSSLSKWDSLATSNSDNSSSLPSIEKAFELNKISSVTSNILENTSSDVSLENGSVYISDANIVEQTSETDKFPEILILPFNDNITRDKDDVDISGELKSKKEDGKISNKKIIEKKLKKEDWISELPFSECSIIDDIITESVSKKKKMKKKIKQKSKKKDKVNQLSPNYFIGIQISDPEVKSQIISIQETITKNNPELKPTLIDVESLHLTLGVLNIDEPVDLLRSLEALENSYNLLLEKEYTKNCILTFEGLGHFRNQVIFATIRCGAEFEQLREISETVQNCFEKKGFPKDDKDEFKPHLTIAKLSKARKLRFKKIKKIPSECYADHMKMLLGTQRINGLQLLSMQRPKEAKGYYKCIKEHLFLHEKKE